MSNTKFNPYHIRQYTPEQFQAFAEAHQTKSGQAAQEKEDSFQRCDTDGFLSQWASGLTSDLNHRQAEILRNNGRAEFRGLYQGSRRVKAKEIRVKNQFSHQTEYLWVLHESERELIAARGKKYLPTGEKSRVLKQLGLSEQEETDWAWAKLDGSGTGLSGTCYVSVFRVGEEWGGEAILREEVTA